MPRGSFLEGVGGEAAMAREAVAVTYYSGRIARYERFILHARSREWQRLISVLEWRYAVPFGCVGSVALVALPLPLEWSARELANRT